MIDKERLKTFAQDFLEFFNEKEISSLAGLDKIMGHTFIVTKPSREYNIAIEIRAPMGFDVYTVAYITPQKGVPLETRLNPVVNYSHIILKAGFKVEGYDSFGKDILGNIVQMRILGVADVSLVKKELERLIVDL